MLPNPPATQSVWELEASPASIGISSSLTGSVETDVLVVGFGITGLTCATMLARAGRRVIVVDAGSFGTHGTSTRTSAHLTALPDSAELKDLIRRFGLEAMQHTINATSGAIDLIESLAHDLNGHCDFRRVTGWRYTESDDETEEETIREDAQHARELGLSVELGVNPDLPFATAFGYRVNNQAAFQPVRYLHALAGFVARQPGCALYQNTPVREYHDGDPCTLRTDDAVITCRQIVLATHSPLGIWLSLHTRLSPNRSYCLAIQTETEIPDGLFWDNEDPYHYIRRVSSYDGHALVVGGADHKTGADVDPEQHFAQVEEYCRERFGRFTVMRRWSAEYFNPADGLPYIGRGPGANNVYVSTGYSGSGLTFGTAGGSLVASLIMGHQSPWADVVNPTRVKPLASAVETMKELGSTVKGLVSDRITMDSDGDFSTLRAGDGKVVRVDGRPMAVHRHESGELKMRSAVCSHMGCIVNWNAVEKTWDCPCHGSIFGCEGEVVAGPALTALKTSVVEHAKSSSRAASKT